MSSNGKEARDMLTDEYEDPKVLMQLMFTGMWRYIGVASQKRMEQCEWEKKALGAVFNEICKMCAINISDEDRREFKLFF
jgi:hypothetical protein